MRYFKFILDFLKLLLSYRDPKEAWQDTKFKYNKNIQKDLDRSYRNHVLSPYNLYERSHSGYESVVAQKNTEYTILLKLEGFGWYFNTINLGEITDEQKVVLCELYKLPLNKVVFV